MKNNTRHKGTVTQCECINSFARSQELNQTGMMKILNSLIITHTNPNLLSLLLTDLKIVLILTNKEPEHLLLKDNILQMKKDLIYLKRHNAFH